MKLEADRHTLTSVLEAARYYITKESREFTGERKSVRALHFVELAQNSLYFRAAFPVWSEMSGMERGRILRRKIIYSTFKREFFFTFSMYLNAGLIYILTLFKWPRIRLHVFSSWYDIFINFKINNYTVKSAAQNKNTFIGLHLLLFTILSF